MILNGVDFETYFRHYPDENGYFGPYVKVASKLCKGSKLSIL